MASIQQIQQNQIGLMLQFTNVPGSPTFTGSTCFITIENANTNVVNQYDCEIAVNGTYAYYITLGAEFLTAGPYKVQLTYEFEGNVFFGPVNVLQVIGNL